jgi:D-galactarolactone cycloisomerase
MMPNVDGRRELPVAREKWEEMYNRARPFGGGAAVNAMIGVDIAHWDAVGRYLGRPVHKLLGGAFRPESTP